MVQDRVDRFLVAVDDVEHAVGQPGLASAARRCRSAAEGSRSDGFSTKVLPQASATGNIHIGTMAGKLNGVMPAQTPSGWRIDQLSTSRADILGELALQQMRDAAGELDDLEPADARSLGVAQHLAVLGGDDGGELVQIGLDQGFEAEHDPGALQRRRRGPGREGGRGRRDRRIDLRLAGKRDLA